MRLFLDANILFSAAYADNSTAGRLFGLQAAGLCKLVTSNYTRSTKHAVTSPQSVAGQSASPEAFVSQLKFVSEPAPERIAAAILHGLPAKDAPILAAAIAVKADVLITGDRTHFGHLCDQVVAGVRVMRLSDVFALLVG